VQSPLAADEPGTRSSAVSGASRPPPATLAASPSVNAGNGVNAIDAARSVIAGQLAAGHIEPDAASFLHNKLDDLAKFHARGQTKQVNDRIDSLRSQLMSMLRAKRVTTDGYNAILAAINRLA
jgi:hypothetical protein